MQKLTSTTGALWEECYQLNLNTPTRILLDWYKKNR